MPLFVTFQDEGEIEDWFETEKERLSDELYKVSFSRKGLPEAKKKFNKAMAKLVERYNKEHAKLHTHLERRKKTQKPRIRYRAWKKQLKKDWERKIKFWKAERKKRKFEKEYKKLMKKNEGVI